MARLNVNPTRMVLTGLKEGSEQQKEDISCSKTSGMSS